MDEDTHAGARHDTAVREAIAAELRLLEPRVRRSPALARELLDPDFVEVGSSGRRWTYAQMLDDLPGLPGAEGDEPACVPERLTGVPLAPGLVHLTYETRIGGVHARRSSLWRRDARAGWRMYYHQATPVPPGAE
ncbi:DUF4440 domain-containing protein [Streptomyces sp. ODS28]|uniref:nuclear transport factor 2 family protein n=1 Tax=Streptomyces sp. ODS28 TaxID=3136688 RepID=UPI0031E96F40